MKFYDGNYFFGQFTGRQNKRRTLQNAKWQELPEAGYVGDIPYAKGSKYKAFETTNFGFVVFSEDTLTPDGNIPGRRIHKW